MVTRHARAYASNIKEKIPEEHRPHAKRTATLGLSGRPLRVAITACAVTGFSLFGYDQGLMSSIISSEQFTSEFPPLIPGGMYDESHVTVLQGGVTSCYEVGCFFGALFVLAFGDMMGRKPTITVGCTIFIIGALISTTAYHEHWGLGQFVLGRVVCGIGNGLNTATIPVWQSEMARPERRGLLVSMEGSVVAIGTMIAYWFDFGLSFINNSIAWRFPVALQIVFALAVLLSVVGLPESSRWLVAKGRDDEARTVLARVYDLPEDHEDVEHMLSNQQFDAKSTGAQVKFTDLFTRGKTAYFSRMVIGASTQFFQQVSGCNAAIYYATVLFEQIFQYNGASARAQRVLSLLLGGVFASVYALFTFPSYVLVDKLGRRNLFMLGISGQAASFLITMSCLAAREDHDKKGKMDLVQGDIKGAAVGLFLFIAFFGMSILPLPWVYPPEINPHKTRTHATAVSTCTNWLFNFTVVMFTPIFINESDWGCYLFFALMNCIWFPVAFFFYPETAGRSLEEVDVIFAMAHEEGKLPFMIARSLPKLNDEEVRKEVYRLGLAEGGPEGDEGYSDGRDSPKERRNSSASTISALSNNGVPPVQEA